MENSSHAHSHLSSSFPYTASSIAQSLPYLSTFLQKLYLLLSAPALTMRFAMLLLFLAGAVVSARATILRPRDEASSVFVASDKSVTFGINLPNDGSKDVYFSLSGPSSKSWIAIGMGYTQMSNSLYIMAYASGVGNNVTISPRLATGNSEPAYTPSITILTLDGAIIANGIMTANGICRNCSSWNGGNIDVLSTTQNMIFASGPSDHLSSTSLSADTNRHASYGSFQINLVQATGIGGLPTTSGVLTSSGATEQTNKSDHDFTPALHAVLMILAFLALMPFGVVVLRFLESVRWHGWNQALASAMAIVGTGIGIYCGLEYNRSRNFNTAHELFGFAIMIAVVVQFVLGILHHRAYRRTQKATYMAPIHVWLGRLVIPCGIANGFLGFPLALRPHYNIILAILTGTVVVLALGILVWTRIRVARRTKDRPTARPLGSNDGSEVNLQYMEPERMSNPRPLVYT